MKRKVFGREIEWERNEVSKFIFTFYYDDEDKQCGVYTKEMSIDETKKFINEIIGFDIHDNFLMKIFKKYFIFTTDTGRDIYLNRDSIFDLVKDFYSSPKTCIIFAESETINDENDSSIFDWGGNIIFEKFESGGCNYRKICSDCSEIISLLLSNISTNITIHYPDLNIFDGWQYDIISDLLITMIEDLVCFSFITNKETDLVLYFSRDNIKTFIERDWRRINENREK